MSATTGKSPLLTDLYEFTMAAVYWEQGMDGKATFSLFLRRQPQRGYFVAAGLASALAMLQEFRFRSGDIDYLNQLGLFKSEFLDELLSLRFTGDVWALPEGTLFFPDEPIMEVTAPIIEAQLVETQLMNIIGVHTLVATKSSRCVYAAQGRKLIDFSLRRTQGGDAGLAVARSTYLVGFDATSNVLAGKIYGIPVAGTMAHSFVQSFDDERKAFEAYAAAFPDRTILLIDTYDVIHGVQLAIKIAHKLAASKKRLIGVRLDSGDMIGLSQQVRRLLNKAGLSEVDIMASGGFDELGLAEAVEKGASIDAFGLGTKVGVSADSPYLDLVYKMVQYEDRNVRKLSPGKETLAGRKQVFRFKNEDGLFSNDIIGHRSEDMDDGLQLLQPVMKEGRMTKGLPSLVEIRNGFNSQFAQLPESYKRLHEPPRYPIGLSQKLIAKQACDVNGNAV